MMEYSDSFYGYRYTRNYWFAAYLWLGFLVSQFPEYSAKKGDKLLDLLEIRMNDIFTEEDMLKLLSEMEE